MSRVWVPREVPLHFSVGDKKLFSWTLKLRVSEANFTAEPAMSSLEPPPDALAGDFGGFLIRSLPVQSFPPVLQTMAGYICYAPSQYERFYIDLSQTFEAYKQKFSSKTRSTINRKIKKFAEHSGGAIEWKVYKTPDEMSEFYKLARTVSTKTYQERLLDAGLPADEGFLQESRQLSSNGCVRAYLLFHKGRPVAYLYCPINSGALLYQYLGYDPEYGNWSVGTILQWFALEDIFRESRFRIFDFTEGQSDHKRQFATHSVRCVNVYFLKRNLRHSIITLVHWLINVASTWTGSILGKIGLKATIRKLIRSSA